METVDILISGLRDGRRYTIELTWVTPSPCWQCNVQILTQHCQD